MCNDVNPNIVVPFTIYECSGYYDKNRPSWKEMKELAINVRTAPMKPAGFKTGPGFQTAAIARVDEDDPDDSDEDNDD